MIVGLGLDLMDVRRMESELRQPDHLFLLSFLTPREVRDGTRSLHPARHYAGCFALKEAVFKALALHGSPRWRDIEIRLAPHGRPSVILRGHTRRAAARVHARRIRASLTQTRTAALGSVVLEA
jgi:holo-[acyl-carrier protein] synthase